MTNEFHTLNGLCSSLVPSGLGYEGVSLGNQVCTVVGSQPGQDRVSGSAYLLLSFGYTIRHLWQVCKTLFKSMDWTFAESSLSIEFWNHHCLWHRIPIVSPDLHRNKYRTLWRRLCDTLQSWFKSKGYRPG